MCGGGVGVVDSGVDSCYSSFMLLMFSIEIFFVLLCILLCCVVVVCCLSPVFGKLSNSYLVCCSGFMVLSGVPCEGHG